MKITTHLPNRRMPSLARQAAGLARSVATLARQAVKGEPVRVAADEQARRMALCQACEFFRASDGRCRRCGCVMRLKSWLNLHCPENKW